jgi:hypothetical protein
MFEATVTTLGLAKIATAISTNTPISIATIKIGDGNGNPTDPSPADTDLVRVVYSATPNRVDIDPQDESRIIAEVIVPMTEGGWTIREIGLYDGDDDLIAISRFPEIYKPLPAEGATTDIACRMFFVVASTAAITLEIDTNVIVATRSWVNNQLSLLIPGGTTDQILTKVSNADGDYEWRNPEDVNVTVEVILEEQTLASGQTICDLATCTTDNLAVYVEGIRLHPDDWAATTVTRVTLATSYSAGSKILFVQNDPAGAAEYLKSANNLSDVNSTAQARTNLELLTNQTYLDALWQLMQQRSYPVGEIMTTRRTGNPSTWMGFGTWERYGQGRVQVGFDEADGSFNALDKIGGAKSHTLSINEMPSHAHLIMTGGRVGDGVGQTFGELIDGISNPPAVFKPTLPVGDNLAHNNMQPYITVFMWRRTA